MVRSGAKREASDPKAVPEHRTPWGLLLAVGPVVLFAAAVSYGVAERHSSTDTWIALAAGQQILTTGEVPRVDTFSYTFAGQPWFNQNWLSHVFFYWLYDRISPSAVILGTWVMNAAIFVLVLMAIRVRSRSWLASWIGASFVALGGYGYLSARPASVGFLLLASLMVILSAVAAPALRRHSWLALLLLPLFGVWGCAHGTFFFGYGLVGLFVGCWLVTRIFKPLAVPGSVRQIVVLMLATALAAGLTIVFGPYGFENFTHPFKVASSDVFRTVNEWRPPYVKARYPPVWAFWASLAVASLAFGLAWLFRETGRTASQHAKVPRDGLRIGLFDVAVVLLGLYMALWARRFAPLFYILAAPTVVTAIVLLTARTPDLVRRQWRVGLLVGSWLGALAVGLASARKAHADFIAPYANQPELDLLERSVRYERVPQPAIEFLNRNDLRVNLMTEWTLAGVVLVQAPNVKVFIDGRSQQVYDERHYLKYMTMLSQDARTLGLALRILDESDTDAVLLRRAPSTGRLMQTLDESDQWTPLLVRGLGLWELFVRPSSAAVEQLVRLEQAGRAWWPALPGAQIGRANLWQLARPPDYDRALQHYRAAVDQQPAFGLTYYAEMARLWIQQNRAKEASVYFRRQAERFRTPVTGSNERVRRALLEQIARCRQMLREAGLPPPG